jgi:AraC-like DNA-binding protein
MDTISCRAPSTPMGEFEGSLAQANAMHSSAPNQPMLSVGPAWRQGLSAGTMFRLNQYMDAHIGESISLEALARVACMSRFHFARRFRQGTGSSPMAYLLQIRIRRARRLLLEGDSKIADIAAELGFFDQSHFTRTFRRATGLSPRAFAQAHRSEATQVPSTSPRTGGWTLSVALDEAQADAGLGSDPARRCRVVA